MSDGTRQTSVFLSSNNGGFLDATLVGDVIYILMQESSTIAILMNYNTVSMTTSDGYQLPMKHASFIKRDTRTK